MIERGIDREIIDIVVEVKVVSIEQAGDIAGKHGLTRINRLSTLFNHKHDCNNLETQLTQHSATNVIKGAQEGAVENTREVKARGGTSCSKA